MNLRLTGTTVTIELNVLLVEFQVRCQAGMGYLMKGWGGLLQECIEPPYG